LIIVVVVRKISISEIVAILISKIVVIAVISEIVAILISEAVIAVISYVSITRNRSRLCNHRLFHRYFIIFLIRRRDIRTNFRKMTGLMTLIANIFSTIGKYMTGLFAI
jgi:hypothetical protein